MENDEFKSFADTREAGAEKIVNNAKEKGGLALLTWHHFKVKLPYYKKAAAGKFDLAGAKKEFNETYKKISTSMTQIEFQREVGRLEVLGELIIREESNKINEKAEVLSYSQYVTEKKKINPVYLTKDAKAMKNEIKKHANKDDDDPTAYTSDPKGEWKADYNQKTGKRWGTQKSKHTKNFEKMFGK